MSPKCMHVPNPGENFNRGPRELVSLVLSLSLGLGGGGADLRTCAIGRSTGCVDPSGLFCFFLYRSRLHQYPVMMGGWNRRLEGRRPSLMPVWIVSLQLFYIILQGCQEGFHRVLIRHGTDTPVIGITNNRLHRMCIDRIDDPLRDIPQITRISLDGNVMNPWLDRRHEKINKFRFYLKNYRRLT